jgi:hypothetical protein
VKAASKKIKIQIWKTKQAKNRIFFRLFYVVFLDKKPKN